MTCPEMVIGAFIPGKKLFDTFGLGQGFKLLASPGQKFMGVGLVTDIPNQAIFFEVKEFEKSDGDFNGSQGRSKVASAFAGDFDDSLTTLLSEGLQLVQIKMLNIPGF